MWHELKPETTLVRMTQGGCRTISRVILTDVLPVALPTLEECDKWSEVLGEFAMTYQGEICNLGYRPELATPPLQQAIDDWLMQHGLKGVPRKQQAVSLACTGAVFHHDADSYTGEVFCVLWLSEDMGWDLYFPHIDRRIPLVYGTIVLFDSALPHGVVARGTKTFDPDTIEYATGTFLSQDLLLGRKIRQVLDIKKVSRAGLRGYAQLNRDGYRESLDEETGRWHMRKID